MGGQRQAVGDAALFLQGRHEIADEGVAGAGGVHRLDRQGGLEVAREDAARQSRYLATYVKPTLAQNAEYPKRWILAGLAGLFLLLIWSILALIYYSIRDRS